MLIFWVTGPHTGRIVTQWRYCKQSKDWRGQTYPQPLLLRSEISLFWRTSHARDFFLELKMNKKFKNQGGTRVWTWDLWLCNQMLID